MAGGSGPVAKGTPADSATTWSRPGSSALAWWPEGERSVGLAGARGVAPAGTADMSVTVTLTQEQSCELNCHISRWVLFYLVFVISFQENY